MHIIDFHWSSVGRRTYSKNTTLVNDPTKEELISILYNHAALDQIDISSVKPNALKTKSSVKEAFSAKVLSKSPKEAVKKTNFEKESQFLLVSNMRYTAL